MDYSNISSYSTFKLLRLLCGRDLQLKDFVIEIQSNVRLAMAIAELKNWRTRFA